MRRPRRRRHFESVRDGFIVFALLSDPQIVVIELVVKFKLGSAADAKPSASPKRG